MTDDKAKALSWVNSAGNVPFQQWALYFIGLGRRFAELGPNEGSRITATFALPVLDRCAMLTTIGLVTALARIPVKVEANRERFEKLKELPVGKAVRVLGRGKLYIGEIVTDPEITDNQIITILVTKDERKKLQERFLCRPNNCMRVEPTDEVSQADHRQRGMRIIEFPEFLAAILGDVPVESLCMGSRLDFVFIGTRSRLLVESEIQIACTEGSRQLRAGNAADVIRLKEGARDFRGMIVSTTTKVPRLPGEAPRLAIYDGASGYLKYRDRFPASHQLVLLDRSEARFSEAVSQLNRDYLQRINEGPPGFSTGAPVGVEQMVFESR
jgi:hypothetical protein